jgi:hypothetical protein
MEKEFEGYLKNLHLKIGKNKKFRLHFADQYGRIYPL